jgi:deoxyribose-phosphate aldolase
MNYSYSDLAKMIDHSLLNPTLTAADLEAGCKLALVDVASVCILPWRYRGVRNAAGSTVAASTTIGFPHGGHTTGVKAAEARQALADGGQELDMVVNISQVLSDAWDYVRQDIAAVVTLAHDSGAKVKVIFENCYLKDEHKIRLCEICGELGADWVKTSTGYGTGGATLEDLALMRAPCAGESSRRRGSRHAHQGSRARRQPNAAQPDEEMLDECRQRLGLPASRLHRLVRRRILTQ